MKKKILLLILVVLILAGGGYFAYKKITANNSQQEEESSKKKKITVPVNVIETTDRPYVKLLPDSTGHYITIVIQTLNKTASSVEYELEYQSGTLLQGFQGVLSLANLPAEDKKLFGSKSAGGAVTYHEDIKGGNLLLTFDDGGEGYAVKSDWKYFDNKTKEKEFSSKDAKFQLNSADLAKHRYLIIYNSPGYPTGLNKTVVSEAYSLASSNSFSGKATLTMRAAEEGDLMIMGWDGEKWHEFTGTVDGKMIEAKVDLMELYLVVKN